MRKKKVLNLNKVTVQNLNSLSKKEAQEIHGGGTTITIFRTICVKSCGPECGIPMTALC